jgi:hypothetical protein
VQNFLDVVDTVVSTEGHTLLPLPAASLIPPKVHHDWKHCLRRHHHSQSSLHAAGAAGAAAAAVVVAAWGETPEENKQVEAAVAFENRPSHKSLGPRVVEDL